MLLRRSVQHPRVPETQEFVRVHSYQSKMVIRPHKSFDEVCYKYFATEISFTCIVNCFVAIEFDLCVFFYTEWI